MPTTTKERPKSARAASSTIERQPKRTGSHKSPRLCDWNGNNISWLGQLLRHTRELKGLPIDALAERTGIPRATLSDVERGKRTQSISLADLETLRVQLAPINPSTKMLMTREEMVDYILEYKSPAQLDKEVSSFKRSMANVHGMFDIPVPVSA